MPATPLLQIRDLRTWYPVRQGVFARVADHIRAVDGVDLEIMPGETLGVVGESGCGKSTLARTILRLETPQTGEILLDGRDVLGLKDEALQNYRRTVQVVFQDPLASLNPRHTVLDLVTEGARVHRIIARGAQRAAATRLLRDVGLGPEALDRYPHAFSGGQRQRICIARALALQPRLLICDEAVSALDLSVRAQVLNLLAELRDRHQLSYLFITHDIGVVQHLADRIAVMYLGRIVELGPAEVVLATPAHPYTQLLLASVPKIGRRTAENLEPASTLDDRSTSAITDANAGADIPLCPASPTAAPAAAATARPAACPFAPRCRQAVERCRREAPELQDVNGDRRAHQVACFLSPSARPDKSGSPSA